MDRTLRHLFSTRAPLLVVGLVALGAPGAPASQLLAGIPLSWPGMLLAAGVLYAAIVLPAPPGRVGVGLTIGFAVVIGLKLLAAASAPPIGLKATYWA
ncbi:MAG: hypothetical protein M3069_32460, partial [Chloroflexota bacterium]|nr:hypothetical protein [Chloroflexota bacterium]